MSVWKEEKEDNKKEYIKYLEIFGAISGLFKDNREGTNAKKPYLYYRNHEQLFAKVFNVEDLTRKDSAFDAIAVTERGRIGVGLKTWVHTRDFTFQKVAEFNKVAPTVFAPLIEKEDYEQLIRVISEYRNERIKLDKRQYNTQFDIYHNITRDDNKMNIVEANYDLIQLDSLELLSQNKSTFTFTDGSNTYKFYASKSVLLQQFDASQEKVLKSIPIQQFEDPFELLKMIDLSALDSEKETRDFIYLPIYSDQHYKVNEKSGFNAWNAASKSKGSEILRPVYEAYIPIPKWIHLTFPGFFGFNALNKQERNDSDSFNLHLPDGRIIPALVSQDDGKSLQTNPQSILGEWILHDVLGLKERELLTMNHLIKLGVDSLKVTKLDGKDFKIELAETNAFEEWKIENDDKIKVSTSRPPVFRPELLED